MLIYAVDDEPLALRLLARAIRQARPDCALREFPWGQPLLDAMEQFDERPDAVFLDMELPGIGGVELAKRVKLCSPGTRIVFVTGFSEHAADAASAQAKGYILKPVTEQAVRRELGAPAAAPPPEADGKRVRIRTFGDFEVYADDKALRFERGKSKEMLAYLVHRGGAVCASREVAAVLFENQADVKLGEFHKIAQCLKRTLGEAGCANIIRHTYKSYALDVSLVDCDCYRFLFGADARSFNAYTGRYMAQYAWANIADACR